jgi:hypothetical protein
MLYRPMYLFIGLLLSVAPAADALAMTPPIKASQAECNPILGKIGNGLPDPGAEGPFDVATQVYDLGEDTADLPSIDGPVELLGEVTYPTKLECGPFPIVFMMHGGHATCVRLNPNQTWQVSQHWPCEPSYSILPSYQGYRYFAEILASHGMVVVSISANGINAGNEIGFDARAELFQRHRELWQQFSTIGSDELGDIFVGKIDLGRVGLMGHSKGGAGAARFLDLANQNGPPLGVKAPHTKSFKIRAVLLIGPVAAKFEETFKVTDTALGVVLPYCDGDVDYLGGVSYYDASRYAVFGDSGPKHSFLVIGANHNNYNTIWDENETEFGTVDDWVFNEGEFGPFCQVDAPGSGRLTSEQQRGTLVAMGGAFFRRYLKNEQIFRPFLHGDVPPPPSAKTEEIFIGYHPKDEPEVRLDVNTMTMVENTLINSLGGAVTNEDFQRFEFCDPESGVGPDGCLTESSRSPETGQAPHAKYNFPVSQLRLAWSNRERPPAEATFSNDIPDGLRDVSGYQVFQFRSFVDFADSLNPFGQPQDLRIVLRDGAGLAASVRVSDHSSALFYPPSVEPYEDSKTALPRAVLNTVRVPLSAFEDVFLTDLRSVELVFDQTLTGAINVADLAFADEAENKPPRVSCSIRETQLSNDNLLVNVGLSVSVEDKFEPTPFAAVQVYSDEDDQDSDIVQDSPDAKDIAPGTLRLRAEQDPNSDGRVYLVLSKAIDDDGAIGHACCTATVPASNSPEDIAAADIQAAAALGLCTSFAASSEGLVSLPTGYFAIGDGPVIGPNQ